VRALTVRPGEQNSAALEERPPPSSSTERWVHVRTLAVGVCGTDAEILSGHHGAAPSGSRSLVLGHESVGTVVAAPPDSGLAPGDWVVGIVRHPDPVPCESCAVGEWDMCRNGLYTEHGIKGRDGFCAELFEIEPEYLVRIDPELGHLGVLVEPTSVVAKAWEHIEHIGRRAHWNPKRVLITGAGPVGLLAALLARERNLEVHLFDRVTDGPKPGLAGRLGVHYHHGPLQQLLESIRPDVVLECTGAASVVLEVMCSNARSAIVCLVGVSGSGSELPVDIGRLNRSIVSENDVVFGSVNANRRHYEQAAASLSRADRDWLGGLLTRRVPLEAWPQALKPRADDVKVVIDLS
jgi:glucose 1-dehydrogenase